MSSDIPSLSESNILVLQDLLSVANWHALVNAFNRFRQYDQRRVIDKMRECHIISQCEYPVHMWHLLYTCRANRGLSPSPRTSAAWTSTTFGPYSSNIS